jgi:drug/metabolite transporter (DMT)-like permease
MVIILYTTMCFIFGTTFLLIKTGMNLGWSPILFSSLRFILAGGILLIFLRKKAEVPLQLHLKIGLISLLMTTIPFGALYYGEQYINSGEAAILVTTSPIFILAFHFLLKKERVLVRQLIGALLCIAGVILLVIKDFSLTTQAHAVVAKGLIIIGEIAFAYGTIQSKALLEKMEASSKFNALIMLYGGIGLWILALLKGERFSVPAHYAGYLILLYFVIIASIVANGIFFALVKRTNAFFPVTWTYVSPLIAMVLGGVILKEHFGLKGIAGACLVLIGVLLANSRMIEELIKKRKTVSSVSIEELK